MQEKARSVRLFVHAFVVSEAPHKTIATPYTHPMRSTKEHAPTISSSVVGVQELSDDPMNAPFRGLPYGPAGGGSHPKSR